jgi:hypothetical protein
MRPGGPHGLVLVPMALTLAFVGALAWAMVREASMSVSQIDLDYDAQVARYLAKAGLSLARWQNQQSGCTSAVQFGSFSLPGGTIVTNAVTDVAGGLSIDVSATTNNGQTVRLANASVPVYNAGKRTSVTWKASSSKADDTYLVAGDTKANGTAMYMELTDDTERGLLQFVLTSLGDVLIVSAQLKLFQVKTKSTATTQLIYLQRVTTPWTEASATWTVPWAVPGGDAVGTPAAVMSISKQSNVYYSVRIDALAEAWMKNRLPNYGVLLTSSGLNQARFGTLEDKAHMPELVLDDYPRCP